MTDHSSVAAASDRMSGTAVGITLIVAGALLFSVYNALGKWLAVDYSAWQIMFFRGLVGFIPFAAWALILDGGGVLRSRMPWLQVLRAAFGFGANVLFILAYREMPLADTVAIGYAAPIFIVVLSVPLLSEHVGIRRASAAFVGFLGVLLIARPGAGVFSVGAFYALGGTLCYSLLIISTRRLGLWDNALCTAVWSSGLYALVCVPFLPQVWVTPPAADFGLLMATGVFASSGLVLFAQAYRRAEAAVLAPFDYTSLLWAALFGYIFWGDVPAPAAAVGMAVIVGSGVFLMRHERLRRLRPDKP